MSNANNQTSSSVRKSTGGGPALGLRSGITLMKTVSVILASARRSSLAIQQRQGTVVADASKTAPKKHRRPRNMEDRAAKLSPKLLESLAKRTHFTKQELDSIYQIYRKLVAHSNINSRAITNAANSAIAKPFAPIEGIDRNCFRELLHTTFDLVIDEALMDRIFIAWEKDHDMQPIRCEGFILGLSVFLRGTLPEHIEFCFRVYDINRDGFIAKDEILTLLRNSMIQQPNEDDPDESIKDLMEFIFRKMDVDSDGKISFSDFAQTAIAEPTMVEAFGQCLPHRYSVVSFIATLAFTKTK